MEIPSHEEVEEKMGTHTDDIYTGTAGRACEACNKKKTKCDRQQPICGLCRRTGHECTFPSSRKRPSRQDPATRAKMQKIDNNIDRLLEILEANSEVDTSDPRHDHTLMSRRQSVGHHADQQATHGNIFHSALTPSHTPSPKANNLPSKAPSKSDKAVSAPSPTPSYELATHLIGIYFDRLQPWCSIFHKPTFLEWCNTTLSHGDDALKDLNSREKGLFNAIFALAARFSEHKLLAVCPHRDRGAVFGKRAEQCLKEIDEPEEWTTMCVQSHILTSVYQYCSGYSQKGWKTALSCIRACYDLRLHEIDDVGDEGEENLNPCSVQWVHQEQRRRLFWAIWEVDLFGSILKRRPLGIDWRHIRVNLPVSDDAWFAGKKVESGMYIHGPEGWKALSKSPNQSPHSWMLLSKSFIGWLSDLALLKDGVTAERKAHIENNLGCFKLAMPEAFVLTSPTWADSHMSMVEQNFAVAINIYLSASAFIVAQLPVSDDLTVRTREEHDRQQLSTYRLHAMGLNNIMRRWPPEAVKYAPPTVACALLTYNESLCKLLPLQEVEISYNNLSELILSKFAERWTIAVILLQVRELAHSSRRLAIEKGADLVKEYPVYFNKFVRWKQDPKATHSWTEKTDSSSNNYNNNNNSHDTMTNNLENIGLKSPSESSTSQHTTPHTVGTQFGLATDSTTAPSIIDMTNMNEMIPVTNPTELPNMAVDLSQPGLQPMNPTHHDYFNLDNNSKTNYNNNNSIDILNPLSIPGFSSISTMDNNVTPPELDDLFSGFLQEPLWQDFQSGNFLV